MDAVKKLRGNKVNFHEVYTPFPVHGLEHALGYKESRLPTVAFIFGITGTFLALLMQVYMYYLDWQINVGGKPMIPLPSFIPITFELTVLLASLGMVTVYMVRNYIGPGAPTKLLDPRQTDDLFVVAINKSDNEEDNDKVRDLYKETGAIEVREQQL
jgi:hypothetical protein